ncbi:phosphatidic acid phosphatase type 2/haloperoxidase [Gorgonomyces haynaldii]|nr:phosphatidic acid phosphatase type 2/haloperoxidase [Gorgonomyces haynaldii]
MRQAFKLTHIEYQEGDNIGKLLAVASLVPILLLQSLGTLVLYNFNAEALVMLIGQLLNEALNYVLKDSIKEPRPFDVGTGYAMPSSHAQFVWFFFVVFSHRIEHRFSTLLSIGVFGLAAAVSYSRVYLQYHTIEQVWAGAAVGFMSGFFYQLIFYPLLLRLFKPSKQIKQKVE